MQAIHVELSPGSTANRTPPPPTSSPRPSSTTRRTLRDALDTNACQARSWRDQYYYNYNYGTPNSTAARDAEASLMMEVELDAILRGERSCSTGGGRSPASSTTSGTVTRRTSTRRSASSSSPHDAVLWGSSTRCRSLLRHHNASPASELASHSPVAELRPPPPLSYVSVSGHTGGRAATHIADAARPLRERRAAMQESIARFLSCGEATASQSTACEQVSMQRMASSPRQHSVTTASSVSPSPLLRPPSPSAPAPSKRCGGRPVTQASASAPLPQRTLFAPMPVNQIPMPTSKNQRQPGDGGGSGENAAAVSSKCTREVQRSSASTVSNAAPSATLKHPSPPLSTASPASSPLTPPRMAATFSLLPYREKLPQPSAPALAADAHDATVLDGGVVTVQCTACALTLCLFVFHRLGAAAPLVRHCPACGRPL